MIVSHILIPQSHYGPEQCITLWCCPELDQVQRAYIGVIHNRKASQSIEFDMESLRTLAFTVGRFLIGPSLLTLDIQIGGQLVRLQTSHARQLLRSLNEIMFQLDPPPDWLGDEDIDLGTARVAWQQEGF